MNWFNKTLIGCLLIAYSCSQYSRENRSSNKKLTIAKVEFFRNEKYCGSNFKDLDISFTIGFEDSTDFTVLKNNQVMKKFRGKTNHSIDFCCDSRGNLFNFYIPFEKLKSGDSIRINTDSEAVLLIIPSKFYLFNRLEIYKDNGIWHSDFENSTKPIILE